MLMSVLLVLIAVYTTVTTPRALIPVVVALDTAWIVMDSVAMV